jgi:hypothetical protein
MPLKMQKKLGPMARWASEAAQPVRLKVPPGTVVRRKRGAVLLADLERVVRDPPLPYRTLPCPARVAS